MGFPGEINFKKLWVIRSLELREGDKTRSTKCSKISKGCAGTSGDSEKAV